MFRSSGNRDLDEALLMFSAGYMVTGVLAWLFGYGILPLVVMGLTIAAGSLIYQNLAATGSPLSPRLTLVS
jgi:hypothetical protein